ncbi:unnamed protein product [Arctia plantaginis]|uniref:Uncharacterized protein n=1 Tax=Arctia plantaginis TaxID=874455 RepID=A0A8S1B054_ARCPL|nr:unnamed protein product [Arctia plantaginis]
MKDIGGYMAHTFPLTSKSKFTLQSNNHGCCCLIKVIVQDLLEQNINLMKHNKTPIRDRCLLITDTCCLLIDLAVNIKKNECFYKVLKKQPIAKFQYAVAVTADKTYGSITMSLFGSCTGIGKLIHEL